VCGVGGGGGDNGYFPELHIANNKQIEGMSKKLPIWFSGWESICKKIYIELWPTISLLQNISAGAKGEVYWYLISSFVFQ